ncbi:MAG TPA: hypothetical protein ENI57_12045 [Ignavibacteria bacterium]|nr:hypothetical protein [Ignavibacteria bacterium]
MKIIPFILILFSLIINAQPKNEVRAVWIATAYNLDWPTSHGAYNQKIEIRNILDSLKRAHFNTIYLQVRARGDLLYPSSIEPFAKSLTGKLGKNPGYDPLKYFIQQSHKRGLELYAWWNVYKVFGKGLPEKTKPGHVVLAHPELCKYYKNEWWLDPGNPKSNEYLMKLVIELVTKYNLDGINLDYMRYPDKDFDDDSTYRIYGKGKNKDEWRRENINKFVTELYDKIISIKPNFKIGSSPLGIYKNDDSTSALFGAYNRASQDSKEWLLVKKQDYISPQIFWNIDSLPKYDILLKEWISHSNGRHVIAGVAAYKLLPEFKNWKITEISDQIDSIRKIGAKGISIYRLAILRNNVKGIYQLLKDDKFKYPAGIPTYNWKDTSKPSPPQNIKINLNENQNLSVEWELPKSNFKKTPRYFNIYLSNKLPVDISNVKNFHRFRVDKQKAIIIYKDDLSFGSNYLTVTSLSSNNVESKKSKYVFIRKKKLLGLTVIQINSKLYYLNDRQLSIKDFY